ncbi:MAG: IS5 family transposase [Hyphomicrobiales bacterium]|uniref:IS5 family transposase n=1 Tax=Roseitalea porphyridii TaxID=1852022 RepID=UPI0032EB190F
MRGGDSRDGSLFSYVDLEARVPGDHPLRLIRRLVDEALLSLDGVFSQSYSRLGRPSIAPEKLLRALLLQAFYSVRSERQLMEQLDYNLLFRWFVGLGVDDPVWVPTVFSKNRDRLLAGDVAVAFLNAVLAHEEVQPLLSDDHFSVDGTLIEAWASMKSFRPIDSEDDDGGRGDDGNGGRNRPRDFHDEQRSNATHRSNSDPDARLYKKGPGKEAKLCFMGHVLMENRHGLIVDAATTSADGHGERTAALHMIEPRADRPGRITLGADKGFDMPDFVNELRSMAVTPHVAAKDKHSAIDQRTTRHQTYRTSQRIRKRIEEAFGWAKTVGAMAKARHRGRDRVAWQFTLTMAAYNLICLPKLLERAP